jgi:starch synthase
MDLLMVAAELGPYVRGTEAADSVASLGKALRQLGHDVTICLPRHPEFERQGLLVARRLTPLVLRGGEEVTVLDGQLASGVRLVLLDIPGLLEGGVLEPGVSGGDPRRFASFAQATVALVTQRAVHGQLFDLVHLHDWPGALVAAAFRALPEFELPIILTVHDWYEQGRFDRAEAETLGLNGGAAAAAELGHQLNLLKAGVILSDQVTTVSRSALGELASDPSDALGAWIGEQNPPVAHISNGVDYALFNPATDPLLVSRFDAEDVANKGRSKTDLVRRLGLELELVRPLVGAVGEITSAGGFDLLIEALPVLGRNDFTLVVAGRGAESLEQALARHAERRRDEVAFVESPDDTFIHRLYAASDVMLVPSRREPGGATVLRAARYGAVPVAHATGAVRDLVVDADTGLETGTGFLFDEPTADALGAAVQRALAAYRSPAWPRLRRRVMRQDLGWDRPARRYQQVYRQAVAARRA